MFAQLTNTVEAVHYYSNMGFDTFPLTPGCKSPPLIRGWNHKSLEHVWNDAPENANIAIRCGGKSHVAVIDCDENHVPGTFNNVLRFLGNLGLHQDVLPIVQTASGSGRHIYIQMSEAYEGSSLNLSRQTGAGEFRYGPGAYVVAPPSRVGRQSTYNQVSGDFANLPEIQLRDIRSLLGTLHLHTHEGEQQKYPSRLAWKILRGDIPSKYPSRSEAEQALIVSLINSGFDFSDIQRFLMKYPAAGKFRELYQMSPDNAIRYLRVSYVNGLRFSKNVSPGRQLAQRAITWAVNHPWPGRTGGYDREIYLAHAQIAYRCGHIIYAASSRTLAELANVSHMAASNGTKRLIGQGLIHKEVSAVANLANQYRLTEQPLLHSANIPLEGRITPAHDVFSYQGLGKTCKQIWEALGKNHLSIKELAGITGRTPQTIKSNLQKMTCIPDFETGELISLVAKVDEKWIRNSEIGLDYVGELLGVNGIMKQRRQVHEIQRELHRLGLQLGKLQD
jgi:hypothetical protein